MGMLKSINFLFISQSQDNILTRKHIIKYLRILEIYFPQTYAKIYCGEDWGIILQRKPFKESLKNGQKKISISKFSQRLVDYKTTVCLSEKTPKNLIVSV